MLSRTPRGWGRLPGSRESLLSRTIKWPDMMSHLWRPHAEYLGCIRVTFFVFGFIETTNPWYEIIRNRQLSLWESAKWLAQRMAPQWRLKSLWGEGSSRTQTFHGNWVQKGPCHHHPGKATFHMAEWKKASGPLGSGKWCNSSFGEPRSSYSAIKCYQARLTRLVTGQKINWTNAWIFQGYFLPTL